MTATVENTMPKPCPHSDLDRLRQIAIEHRVLARNGEWATGHLRKADAVEDAVAEIVTLRDQMDRLWSENDSLNTLVSSWVEHAMRTHA